MPIFFTNTAKSDTQTQNLKWTESIHPEKPPTINVLNICRGFELLCRYGQISALLVIQLT